MLLLFSRHLVFLAVTPLAVELVSHGSAWAKVSQGGGGGVGLGEGGAAAAAAASLGW